MPVVPAIPARAPIPNPALTFEAPFGYEDQLAGFLHVQWPRLGRQRRLILMVGLPLMWFLACLGAVSTWATAGGPRDFGRLMGDLPRLDLLPLALCLAAIAGCFHAYWAVYPTLMRRQLRIMMGSSGGRDPVTLRYRFDQSGMTRSHPGLMSFIPWSDVLALGEDGHHFFITTTVSEEAIAIPKDGVSSDVAERLRRAVYDLAGRSGASSAPLPDPPEAGAQHVVFEPTVDERVAVMERMLTTPAAHRARLVGAVGWLVALSLLYPAIVAATWCIDPYQVPFEAAFPLLVEMIDTDFWKGVLAAATLVGLGLVADRLFRRPALQSLAAEMAFDPARGEAEMWIGEGGIVTMRGGAHAHLAWSLFQGCERMGDLLVLPLGWGLVLPPPLRALDPDGLDRFESLTTRHLPGTKDTS
ncbi:YcxB family protein [Methylobacterium iners]|uniref:YcxB-like C-terminal domain-containing protein n=1 Tax=Methylobacterium iners TaxID=418707 RepID=A0ABQ4RQQ4_9HYPH|nr:YcxB family protein [Methylobacterium iners]GJD93096.1 hypothetical protein OCOJLMKI_0283 [Methylobacterium iners]